MVMASGSRFMGASSRKSAAKTTATTAAATPRNAGATSGIEPYAQYSQAIGRMISIAGVMKQIPAAISPGIPARINPRWIAVSVEFGPGIKFTAARMSRKCCRSSHLRRDTSSSSIIATCTGGPPNAVNPRRVKNKITSRRRDCFVAAGAVSFIGERIIESMGCLSIMAELQLRSRLSVSNSQHACNRAAVCCHLRVCCNRMCSGAG